MNKVLFKNEFYYSNLLVEIFNDDNNPIEKKATFL